MDRDRYLRSERSISLDRRRWSSVTVAVSEDVVQGNLEDFPLAALLRSLESRRRTGALVIGEGSEIWFSNGQVYLATVRSGSSLSEVLYGADIGTLAEVEAMFAATDTDESVLDQILSTGPELEPLIRRLLHEYNLNSLFELLVPSKVDFSFENDRSHRLGNRLAGDTGTLLAQAEYRVEIWRRIASRIPSTTASFRLATSMPGYNHERLVTADEWQYLARLDGRNTVADVITHTGQSAFRVCSTLYRLLLEGIIEEVV